MILRHNSPSVIRVYPKIIGHNPSTVILDTRPRDHNNYVRKLFGWRGVQNLSALVLVLFFLNSSALAETADSTWTLSRCIITANESSPLLQSRKMTSRAVEADYSQSKSSLWPVLSLNGSYGYTSETMHLEIPGSPLTGGIGKQISFGDGNTYDLNAGVRVPIYGGGTVKAQSRASEMSMFASRMDLASDSLALMHDVRAAFFKAVGAKASLDAASNRVSRLSRHVNEIESAQKIGMATEEAKLTATANLRAAESQVLNLEAKAKSARLYLGSLLGTPDKEIYPSDELEASLIENTSQLEFDAEQRPEVKALDLRLKQSDYFVRSAKGSLLPSLAGSAAYHYGKPGVNQTADEWMDYYTLGATASWTLWDFGGRSNRIQSTRFNQNALEYRRDDLIRNLSTVSATARALWESSLPGLEKLSERRDLERQRMELVEGRLQAGMATESEYLDAIDDLTAAELDWVDAQVTLRLREADLLYANGF
jgi:outer membrane protein TolC